MKGKVVSLTSALRTTSNHQVCPFILNCVSFYTQDVRRQTRCKHQPHSSPRMTSSYCDRGLLFGGDMISSPPHLSHNSGGADPQLPRHASLGRIYFAPGFRFVRPRRHRGTISTLISPFSLLCSSSQTRPKSGTFIK